ncbi:MAG: hypothetical protein SCALA702_31420 [Melioribacteraceae bacterium]|nr:MAG: hypothetical protein SCALA702_31420 [Melioribacteraceae bacterium]
MILINLLVVAIVVIIILVVKLSKQKTEKVFLGDDEFIKLQEAFKGLKSDYDQIKDENKSLNKHIDQLKDSISELEETNISLLEQKQQLTENENALKDLQKQKEELFAIAIHDIKNPLSAIKGYVQLLEEYDLNAVEQQEIMTNLISSTDKILDLAFEMNRVVIESEREQASIKAGEVSVYDTIKSVCAQNTAYAKKKKVRLVNQASQNTPRVKIAADKLEEVLFNLINNAIKFSPENTIVQIKSFFNNSSVTIEVIDDGKGIAEEDLPKAFTKGGKLTAKPTGDEKSTGLGLWIVKKIVEENFGEVWVKSKLNIGSTFGFKVPISPEDDEE